MTAQEKHLLHFLEGSDKHFVIPVYQRNYDWKKEQCIQLFNDLLNIKENNRTHFLGSLVSIYHADSRNREYLIIDGQQRLTTVSLLLLAIYNLIDNDLVETNVNKEQLRDEYLVNKYSTEDKKIRLKPVKKDMQAFKSLFESEDDYIEDTNITINYKYFYNRILNDNISVDDLFYAINQLIIVEIELKNGEDDPQLIFESLNSTGLDLSEADKVRNFVLMKENSSTQEEYYNKYWNKIEINTNYDVSNFIRNYLTLKERIIPNKSKVYLYFKNYVIENVNDNEELLKDLLKYSKYYNKIINPDNSNIGNSISKINRLESIVTYPFLMELFYDLEIDIIDSNDLNIMLEIIVSFVFRRFICEVPTNALNKIFMVLGREIKKYNDYKNNYLEIFKRVITIKKYSQRFPTNEEFVEKMKVKDIYNFKNKNKLFLLEQLENFDNRERVDVENLISTNELTIEHIMPQTLTPIWREQLGTNYEIIKEKYINTIGNLTLTGYNSKMSNKPFLEKRDMEKGFSESRLYLNKSLARLDQWTETEIKNRALKLVEKSLIIWNYPESTYESEEDKLKLFTLSDDETNFTGEGILAYKIMEDKENKVDSWKEFYKKVCKVLYELDPVKFKKIITDHTYIYIGSILKDAFKIDDFYVYSNLNIESFLTRLRIIVNEIGLNLDEVSFIIE